MDEQQQMQVSDAGLWSGPGGDVGGETGSLEAASGYGPESIPPTTADNAGPRADLMSQYADDAGASAVKPAADDGYRGAPDKPLEDSFGNSLVGGVGSRLVSGLGFVGRLVAGQIARWAGKRT